MGIPTGCNEQAMGCREGTLKHLDGIIERREQELSRLRLFRNHVSESNIESGSELDNILYDLARFVGERNY